LGTQQENARSGSDSFYIGLRHKGWGQRRWWKCWSTNGCVFFIEMRNLKIPATGNPCVLTAG